MAAQAKVEGRFLGGRPPYGYQLADAGPHPNPAKAADGKRIRRGSNREYRFWSVRPAAYPIPDDGPVGDLLVAAGRGPMRPAHLHFMVSAPGYQTLITHIFAAGDPYLDRDAVFGVKDSLIVEFTDHPAGPGPDGQLLDSRWTSAHFDIVLAAAQHDSS